MLSVACVHPKGENDEYDGLYLRDCEMDRIARDLQNCPILVEHDSKPVGEVLHAFKDSTDGRLYAVFETDPSTFGGAVAGSLISSGIIGEVSLGHECKIEHSADGSQRVVGKIPTELSIVQKGAREGTHIYGKTKKIPSKRYIKLDKQIVSVTKPKMTDSAPQVPHPEQTKQNDEMVKQLLEQVKKLTEQHTLNKRENDQLKEANGKFAAQVEQQEAAGKRKRENLLNGSVKEYFAELMNKYETELKPHEEQLQGMMDAMKSNSASEPMVQALACAAAAAKGSVTELEESYQAQKKLKTEIDELKAKMTNQATPMFGKKEERVEVVEAQASKTASPAEPNTFNSIFGGVPLRTPASMKGAGMRERNPAMWNDLLKNAPRGKGMPKIDAFMSMIQK